MPNKKNYPDDILDTNQMNRIFRHKLRNFCGGLKLTVDAMSKKTQDAYVLDKLPMINHEIENILSFSKRMDILFAELAKAQDYNLSEILKNISEYFSSKFPQLSLDMQGDENDFKVKSATWIEILLKELIDNAAEAAGRGNEVQICWKIDETLAFFILNSGKPWAENIPSSPPSPFFTNKGSHVGIGTAIVQKICNVIDAKLTIEKDLDGIVAVKVTNIKYF